MFNPNILLVNTLSGFLVLSFVKYRHQEQAFTIDTSWIWWLRIENGDHQPQMLFRRSDTRPDQSPGMIDRFVSSPVIGQLQKIRISNWLMFEPGHSCQWHVMKGRNSHGHNTVLCNYRKYCVIVLCCPRRNVGYDKYL